ncbi:hypothetical protein UFOVP112_275 [uncultured Caudovirales phage]|uniref:Uncharacterized protein n=1 Tax=uncultured Caudovirales phage TaxID=2100421 RepID=A0A6J5L860_9CAUD|nr:hypothetical protein UFOVP112_275 [uncultured Caudovirales phage]
MFQLPAEDRLRSWREFRSAIESLSIEQALAQTSEFWAGAPFVPYNLDTESMSNWPDPWTLVYENSYCDVAKCLGIVYTMSLTGHKKNLAVEIRVYEDPKTRYRYNLAWFNQGKYILNMIDGEVLNNKQFDKTLKLVKQYSEEQLQLENY